ncbi:MAG: DUF4190 domain-containing protein [Nanoarchaeota archaeon]
MKESKTNIYAILSFVFAFIFFPLGFVFGVVALYQLKRTHEHGKGLAVAGVILSSLAFFGALLVYSAILFAVGAVGNVVEETAKIAATPDLIDTLEEETASEPKISLKVLSTKTFSYIGNAQYGFGKKPAGTFLVFEIEIKNIDTEPVYITTNDMKLFDKQGRKYVPDTEAMIYREDAFNFETLNPGVAQKGVVIFDVADPKAEYELKVYDNVFSLLD